MPAVKAAAAGAGDVGKLRSAMGDGARAAGSTEGDGAGAAGTTEGGTSAVGASPSPSKVYTVRLEISLAQVAKPVCTVAVKYSDCKTRLNEIIRNSAIQALLGVDSNSGDKEWIEHPSTVTVPSFAFTNEGNSIRHWNDRTINDLTERDNDLYVVEAKPVERLAVERVSEMQLGRAELFVESGGGTVSPVQLASAFGVGSTSNSDLIRERLISACRNLGFSHDKAERFAAKVAELIIGDSEKSKEMLSHGKLKEEAKKLIGEYVVSGYEDVVIFGEEGAIKTSLSLSLSLALSRSLSLYESVSVRVYVCVHVCACLCVCVSSRMCMFTCVCLCHEISFTSYHARTRACMTSRRRNT